MGPPVAGVDGNWSCTSCQNVNFPTRLSCNRCQAPKPGGQVADPPPPSHYQEAPAQRRSGPPVAGVDGNWACPACQNVNFPTRSTCNRCQTPNPADGLPPAPAFNSKKASGAPIAGAEGNWQCEYCQNVNYPVRNACNRCQAPKPQAPQQRAQYQHPSAQKGAGPMRVAPPQRVPVPVPLPSQYHYPPSQPPAPGGGKGGKGGPPVAGVDGNWACPACQNVNFGVRDACNRCQTPKPYEDPHYSSTSTRPAGPPTAGENGNWACPLCQNVNFPERDKCNRCLLPRPAEQAPPGPPPQYYHAPAHRPGPPARSGGPPVPGVDGNWACPACQNVNFGVREACNRCQGPKPQEQAYHYPPPPQHHQQQGPRPGCFPSGAPMVGVAGNWACPGCGNVNYAVREACNRCQTPRPEDEEPGLSLSAAADAVYGAPPVAAGQKRGPPQVGVDGNWACPGCNNVNFGVRTECNRCQSPKPEDVATDEDQLNDYWSGESSAKRARVGETITL